MSPPPLRSVSSRGLTGPALLVTCDDGLLGDVLRLAAAAGLDLDVAHDPAATMRAWPLACTVLVGADQAPRICALGLGRREEVYVVSSSRASEGVFRSAVTLGASSVVELPEAEVWLVELLTDVADGSLVEGMLVGVVGGSGGVGATTLASALATTAARQAPAMLVDLDPLGPGAGRVVGFDDVRGLTWPDLAGSAGRLGSRALRDAVPCRDGLGVLTWPTGTARSPEPAVLGEVLSAAVRGHALVVADLPRHTDEAAGLAARCDEVVMVAAADIAGVASAARVASALREGTGSLSLVVRRGRLDSADVAAALDLPLLAELGTQKRLAEHVDLGLGPVHSARGPVAAAARSVLEGLRGAAA